MSSISSVEEGSTGEFSPLSFETSSTANMSLSPITREGQSPISYVMPSSDLDSSGEAMQSIAMQHVLEVRGTIEQVRDSNTKPSIYICTLCIDFLG